jgi:hypothetical protein
MYTIITAIRRLLTTQRVTLDSIYAEQDERLAEL